MRKQVRARFSNGVIEPLEKLDLAEGEEIVVSIEEEKRMGDGFEKAAGSWQEMLDIDEFLKDILSRRRRSSQAVDL